MIIEDEATAPLIFEVELTADTFQAFRRHFGLLGRLLRACGSVSVIYSPQEKLLRFCNYNYPHQSLFADVTYAEGLAFKIVRPPDVTRWGLGPYVAAEVSIQSISAFCRLPSLRQAKVPVKLALFSNRVRFSLVLTPHDPIFSRVIEHHLQISALTNEVPAAFKRPRWRRRFTIAIEPEDAISRVVRQLDASNNLVFGLSPLHEDIKLSDALTPQPARIHVVDVHDVSEDIAATRITKRGWSFPRITKPRTVSVVSRSEKTSPPTYPIIDALQMEFPPL